MKKVVAFLLVLFIFVTPVTTFVKADVVIGDNDETIINENATILGRKLALLESLSDLALSGVTEFTISNTNDVDSYLDSLWYEVNDAIDYINSGEGFQDLSNELKSKYFYNLINYRDYINNRGDYLSYTLQNPSTSLLKTYFANNIYGKIETSHYDLALDMFRSLSALNNNVPTPQPQPDFSFISNINNLYQKDGINLMADNFELYDGSSLWVFGSGSIKNTTICCDDYIYNGSHTGGISGRTPKTFSLTDICTINVITNQDNTISVIYTNSSILQRYIYQFSTPNNYANAVTIQEKKNNNNAIEINPFGYSTAYFPQSPYIRNSFNDLSTCINYLYQHYCNVNLYVDGVPWALAENGSILNPILDIDGFLKLYGNDTPKQYELQPNTKIDYDQLYQVIYNAIRDNLPISQGDINYYDSHDTIYSPTIINNYGEEEGNESDLIDTILDYAVIPKFDTAIAQPMRQALNNGVVIMQDSITNVIPNEILLILGACFFLLLFAVVINRMIK